MRGCVQGRPAQAAVDAAPGPGAYDTGTAAADDGPAFSMPRAIREVAGGQADVATGVPLLRCIYTRASIRGRRTVSEAPRAVSHPSLELSFLARRRVFAQASSQGRGSTAHLPFRPGPPSRSPQRPRMPSRQAPLLPAPVSTSVSMLAQAGTVRRTRSPRPGRRPPRTCRPRRRGPQTTRPQPPRTARPSRSPPGLPLPAPFPHLPALPLCDSPVEQDRPLMTESSEQGGTEYYGTTE